MEMVGSAEMIPVDEQLRQAARVGRRPSKGWVWLPLSFIFLLLGVVLGFQIAISFRPQTQANADPYDMDLSITPAGSSIQVSWARNAPVIQSATKGWLLIEDGGRSKVVDLTSEQLRSGRVIYRKAAGDMRFRLEVLASGKVSVAQTIDFNPRAR